MIPVKQLAQASSDLAAAGAEIAVMYEHMNRLRDERDAMRAEVDRLKGLTSEIGRRPAHWNGPEHQHPAITRYGLRWSGPQQPVSAPMADGYWTPAHAAVEALQTVEAERDALRAEVEQLRANDANDASALDDKLAAGWLKPREDGESMRSVLDRLIEWNRSVAIDPAVSSAAAELVDRARAEERERWQKMCKGSAHPGCAYSATCGMSADNVEDHAAQVAAHEKVGDFIRGHDAGWKSCEEHMKAQAARSPIPQNAMVHSAQEPSTR